MSRGYLQNELLTVDQRDEISGYSCRKPLSNPHLNQPRWEEHGIRTCTPVPALFLVPPNESLDGILIQRDLLLHIRWEISRNSDSTALSSCACSVRAWPVEALPMTAGLAIIGAVSCLDQRLWGDVICPPNTFGTHQLW